MVSDGTGPWRMRGGHRYAAKAVNQSIMQTGLKIPRQWLFTMVVTPLLRNLQIHYAGGIDYFAMTVSHPLRIIVMLGDKWILCPRCMPRVLTLPA